MRHIPNDIILGENSWSSHHEIELEEAARRRHLYIIGQTGTGKSTLLLNLIEPHGLLGADEANRDATERLVVELEEPIANGVGGA